MYNHYIPQSDGTHRRSSVPESRRNPQRQTGHNQRPEPKPAPRTEPKQEPSPPKPEDHPAPPRHLPPPEQSCPPGQGDKPEMGLLSFLRGLLPRQIDTADMMILFLLLLMNKDEQDGLSPMLTLALYFLL